MDDPYCDKLRQSQHPAHDQLTTSKETAKVAKIKFYQFADNWIFRYIQDMTTLSKSANLQRIVVVDVKIFTSL